jgi:hypothetical protein
MGNFHKSIDGGKTWQLAYGRKNMIGIPQLQNPVIDIAIHPYNHNLVYVGVNKQGIYKTNDGGEFWEKKYGSNVSIGANDYFNFLRIPSDKPDTIYFSSFVHYSESTIPNISWLFGFDKEYGSVPGAIGIMPLGLKKSEDGGDSWKSISFPNGSILLTDIELVSENNIYVSSTSYKTPVFKNIEGEGIYKSTDLGASWISKNYSSLEEMSKYPIYSLCYDPKNINIIFAATGNAGIFASNDGGDNWKLAPALPSGTFAGNIKIAGNKLFALTSNGIYSILLSNVFSNFDEITNCSAYMPNPILSLIGTEDYEVRGNRFTRYKLDVINKTQYPDVIFAPAPHLTPCGLNKNSARTWVQIYESNGRYIYGFCALAKSENLGSVWFAVPIGGVPPDSVYIKLSDRECKKEYISNTINIPNIPKNQSPVIQSLRIATLDEKGILRIKDMSGNTFDEFQIGILADPQILWAPNGEYILLAEGREARNIYLVRLKSRRVEKWNNIPPGIRHLKWSPTSDRISADIASGKGWRQDIVSLDGITWRTSYKDWIVNNTAYWGPDGKFLAFAGSPSDYNFRLYLINADSGKITDRTPPGVFSTGFGNGWLNDGRLVFFAKSGFGETHDLLNPKTGSVTTLLHNPSVGRIGNIRISPSTKNIAYTTVEGDKHTLYLKGMNDTISKKKWSVDFAVDLYIESWSPLEDYVLFTVQSDRMGTIRRAYVLNTKENAVFPLDGNTYFFVQHKGYITSYRYWVTNKDFILSSVDWNSRLGNVFVTNVSGEKHELCNIRPNVSCAIWYP